MTAVAIALALVACVGIWAYVVLRVSDRAMRHQEALALDGLRDEQGIARVRLERLEKDVRSLQNREALKGGRR